MASGSCAAAAIHSCISGRPSRRSQYAFNVSSSLMPYVRNLEHTGARPLGQDVVRVRAWVNPSKQFWSELVIEASYRPFDDPSRPERELDLPLPDDHALQRKIAGVIRRLVEAHGDPATLPAAPRPARPDTTRPKPDTAFAFRKAP